MMASGVKFKIANALCIACGLLFISNALGQSGSDTAGPGATTSDTSDDELKHKGAPPTHAEDKRGELNEEALEAAGVRVGEIVIDNGDVFDPSIPEENRAIFRLANRLHIETKPAVVQRQLLFKSGDPFSVHLMRESERILRGNDYLFDARITPVRVHDGLVDLVVHTTDVWTLNPGVSFGRSGGENSAGFQFEESNLLGTGRGIMLGYDQDVDRSSRQIRYTDPHFRGTWNELRLAYENNSDGKLRDLSYKKPFYSLATTRAAGAGYRDWDRIDSRYNLGDVVDKFRHIEERIEASAGWAAKGHNGDWIKRYSFGLAYEADRFETILDPLTATTLPEDRRLAYPFFDLELLQDAFEERRNQDQIERTEDFYAGPYLRARVGYASEAWGSDRNAAILQLKAGTTIEHGDEHKYSLLIESKGGARYEGGKIANALYGAEGRYYWRVSQSQLFFASLSGTVSKNLDPEQQVLLGGDNGLRGYPLRYQDGSARALLTLEQRVFTKYYLFRLFHVGGAAFFDVGRTWGQGTVSGPTEGLLKDIGVGLRFGSSRSAFGNVIHVDLAFPLDGDSSIDKVQLVVETKKSF
jgi:hypothetical protein